MSEVLEVKKAVDGIQSAFEQFKKTNEEALKELASKGHVDALLAEKQSKIDAELDRLQTIITKASRLPHSKSGEEFSADEMEHSKAFGGFLRKGVEEQLRDIERKAMSVGSDPDGGYFVPRDTSGRMITRIYETSPIRQYASVATISTDALEGMNDLNEASSGWVGETATRSETNTPQTGMWKIPVFEQYAEPRITQKLLDDSAFNVEQWLTGKVTDKFARAENYAFILGNGVSQPRGLFSYTTAATADGSRSWGVFEHVATGQSGDWASSNKGDILFDLVGKMKAALRQGAVWVTNKAVVTAVRKFKGSDNNYLWTPGLVAGQAQSLLGYPIAEMEDVPAIAADSLSLAFANLREAYQVVDRFGIRVLRDPYTAKPYVKYYTTKRVGGDALNFDAAKFAKFGTS